MPQQNVSQPQNKELVLGLINKTFNERKPAEAVTQFVGPYKQHNPTIPDGPQGLISFANDMNQRFPQMTYDIKRTFQDGDHVIVHAHLKTNPNDLGTAVVDIFRVDAGKVVEHWDVMQPVPKTAVNTNTMF